MTNINKDLFMEKLEQLTDHVYATDSVTDIANWIVNKPKTYRILYDEQRDIWGIADAKNVTHKQICRDMYDSGYVIVPDDYIAKARKRFDMYYADTAADVFAQDAFYGNGKVYAAIFLPSNIAYKDYEEQGFYTAETMLEDGSIFTRRREYFSENGPMKDLYRKLKIMGQITGERRSLEDLEKMAREEELVEPFKSLDTIFCKLAIENGYTMKEATAYIHELPDYSLSKMFQDLMVKVMNADKAADLLRQRAKRFGYTKKEVEKFLTDFWEV